MSVLEIYNNSRIQLHPEWDLDCKEAAVSFLDQTEKEKEKQEERRFVVGLYNFSLCPSNELTRAFVSVKAGHSPEVRYSETHPDYVDSASLRADLLRLVSAWRIEASTQKSIGAVFIGDASPSKTTRTDTGEKTRKSEASSEAARRKRDRNCLWVSVVKISDASVEKRIEAKELVFFINTNMDSLQVEARENGACIRGQRDSTAQENQQMQQQKIEVLDHHFLSVVLYKRMESVDRLRFVQEKYAEGSIRFSEIAALLKRPRDSTTSLHLSSTLYPVNQSNQPIHVTVEFGKSVDCKLEFSAVAVDNPTHQRSSWSFGERSRRREGETEKVKMDEENDQVAALVAMYKKTSEEFERKRGVAAAYPSGAAARGVPEAVPFPGAQTDIPIFHFFNDIMSDPLLSVNGVDFFIHLCKLVLIRDLHPGATYKDALLGLSDHVRHVTLCARVIRFLSDSIAHAPDTEGESFTKPYQSMDLASSQADCEDLCALSILMYQWIYKSLENKSYEKRLDFKTEEYVFASMLREFCEIYQPVACLMTSRSPRMIDVTRDQYKEEEGRGRRRRTGEEVAKETGEDGLHMVCLLMPREHVSAMKSSKYRKPILMPDRETEESSALFMESMLHVQELIVDRDFCTRRDHPVHTEFAHSIQRDRLDIRKLIRDGTYKDVVRMYIPGDREYFPLNREGKIGVSLESLLWCDSDLDVLVHHSPSVSLSSPFPSVSGSSSLSFNDRLASVFREKFSGRHNNIHFDSKEGKKTQDRLQQILARRTTRPVYSSIEAVNADSEHQSRLVRKLNAAIENTKKRRTKQELASVSYTVQQIPVYVCDGMTSTFLLFD